MVNDYENLSIFVSGFSGGKSRATVTELFNMSSKWKFSEKGTSLEFRKKDFKQNYVGKLKLLHGFSITNGGQVQFYVDFFRFKDVESYGYPIGTIATFTKFSNDYKCKNFIEETQENQKITIKEYNISDYTLIDEFFLKSMEDGKFSGCRIEFDNSISTIDAEKLREFAQH